MSYRHSTSSQVSDDFHGLKDAISEADYSMDGSDEKRDKKKETKKFLFKKDSKDKGYSTLAADNSQDSVFLVNTKIKKPKTDNKKATLNVFKKSKEDKHLKGIKESKEDVKRSKNKLKEQHGSGEPGTQYKHETMFGNTFENAVRYFASSDGVKVPYPIRICIDVIEQKGIDNENIYRHSTNKSLIESICESINNDKIESRLDELNADPNLACGVIKRFLKESKSPLVTDECIALIDKFDPNLATDKMQKVEHLKRSISKLPAVNFETFAYLVMHFYRVLSHSHTNKIEVGLFVQKFQPLFRIKERTFKFLIVNADLIFSDFRFKKCRIKAANDEANSRLSQLPDSIEGLEQEIAKQEVHLAKLHSQIANQEKSDPSEQEKLSEELWTLQRYVTSLKRKVKKLKNERKIELEQQQEQSKPVKTAEENQEVANLSELYSKEMNTLCENFVLIEQIHQYLGLISTEKSLISELHQKLLTNYSTSSAASAAVSSNLSELKENEQLLINENKLLEERINLINKRIKNEKEKIFELKLNIKLKMLENATSNLTAADQVAGRLNSNSSVAGVAEKEMIMTKL